MIPETLQADRTERFRYPPRPPTEQGFTVFGPLRELHLRDAEGAFSTLDHPFLAPTDMKLHDVDVIGSSGEAEIPVPASEGHENLDISTAGKSMVAGAKLVPGQSFNLSLALLAAGVITGILSLYFGAASWFARREPKSP
jgi:hypothetical protein